MAEKIPLKDVSGKIYVCRDCGALAKHHEAREKPLTSFHIEVKKEKGATFLVCKKCDKKMLSAT